MNLDNDRIVYLPTITWPSIAQFSVLNYFWQNKVIFHDVHLQQKFEVKSFVF